MQLGAQIGYLFGASVDTVGGQIGIDGGASYTLNAGYLWRYGLVFLASYTFFPTNLTSDTFLGPSRKIADLDMHFFQIGVEQEFIPGPVRPFGSFTLGATLFNPGNGLDSETRFSTIFGLGVKFFPAKQFGLRVQARVLSTWEDSGSTIFCGPGGCAAGTFGVGITHVELGGGAFVSF